MLESMSSVVRVLCQVPEGLCFDVTQPVKSVCRCHLAAGAALQAGRQVDLNVECQICVHASNDALATWAHLRPCISVHAGD